MARKRSTPTTKQADGVDSLARRIAQGGKSPAPPDVKVKPPVPTPPWQADLWGHVGQKLTDALSTVSGVGKSWPKTPEGSLDALQVLKGDSPLGLLPHAGLSMAALAAAVQAYHQQQEEAEADRQERNVSDLFKTSAAEATLEQLAYQYPAQALTLVKASEAGWSEAQIRRAIEKMEAKILEGHLHHCVMDAVREGRSEESFSELVELYRVANK